MKKVGAVVKMWRSYILALAALPAALSVKEGQSAEEACDRLNEKHSDITYGRLHPKYINANTGKCP